MESANTLPRVRAWGPELARHGQLSLCGTTLLSSPPPPRPVTEEGFSTLDGSAALLGSKLSSVIIKLGLG